MKIIKSELEELYRILKAGSMYFFDLKTKDNQAFVKKFEKIGILKINNMKVSVIKENFVKEINKNACQETL